MCIRPPPGRASAPCWSMRWRSLPRARGAKRLTAEVSDSAQDFFEKRGFVAQQRNTVLRGGEWLANTTMEKTAEGDNAMMELKSASCHYRRGRHPGRRRHGAQLLPLVSAMPRERLYLFDTTLRDGAQMNGVDFTLHDKLTDREAARRARHRLHRGRLSGREPDRHRAVLARNASSARRSRPSA